MRAFLSAFILNIQFFTSIPISRTIHLTQKRTIYMVQTLPILGIVLGCLYSLAFYLFYNYTPFSDLAISIFTLLIPIILTGALHLDGYMDVCDAFFSYKDKHKRLEIMSDPRVGAFAVISIIILLVVKFLFIYESIMMFDETSSQFYFAIALIPFISRSVIGTLLITTVSSKEKGLASFFKKGLERKHILSIFLQIVVVGVSLYSVSPSSMPLYSIMWLVALLFLIWIRSKWIKWFGGINGDTLGATVEGMEMLLWMILWLSFYFVTG